MLAAKRSVPKHRVTVDRYGGEILAWPTVPWLHALQWWTMLTMLTLMAYKDGLWKRDAKLLECHSTSGLINFNWGDLYKSGDYPKPSKTGGHFPIDSNMLQIKSFDTSWQTCIKSPGPSSALKFGNFHWNWEGFSAVCSKKGLSLTPAELERSLKWVWRTFKQLSNGDPMLVIVSQKQQSSSTIKLSKCRRGLIIHQSNLYSEQTSYSRLDLLFVVSTRWTF